jgi:glutathione S-transferase
MPLSIVIGNKRYSSWSLRGWLAARLAADSAGESLAEQMIWLDTPTTRAELLAVNPAARVPVLRHQGRVIWDSLAIGLYLARTYPKAGLLPADGDALALCLSVAAEMHSGFQALRDNMPMELVGRFPGEGRAAGVAEDIARVQAIWQDCRQRFGGKAGGPFLFGAPTLADCFYAPVATRFFTYDVALDPVSAAYRDAILAWPLFQDWAAPAQNEPALPNHGRSGTSSPISL